MTADVYSPTVEAERITAQAAAQVEIDRRRREWDAAVEEYCMRFGFDLPEESAA